MRLRARVHVHVVRAHHGRHVVVVCAVDVVVGMACAVSPQMDAALIDCTLASLASPGIILLFCLGCMVFMMFILAPTLGKTELSEKSLLIVLFVVTVVLSCLALRKVYQRWRFSSSQQVIEAVADGGEYARAEDIIIDEDRVINV